MKTCSNCSAANQDAARFCGLCLRAFPSGPGLGPEQATAASAVSTDYLAPGQALPVPEPWDSNYLPPTPESFIEDRRRSILLPSTELLTQALAFLMENLKFYLLLSLTVSMLTVLALFTIGGPMASSFLSLIATRQATPQALASAGSTMVADLLVLGGAVVFLSLLGRLAVMVATVEMSKGFELSIAAAIFEALKKALSFLWISLLQAVFSGGIIIAGLAVAAALRGESAAPLIIGLILGVPVAVVVGTWFSMAAFVYLDKDTRGLAALAKSKELIGARWPNVCWRYFVFVLAVLCAQAIPVLWIISGLALTPLSAIFPWLLYGNLRALEDGVES